MTLGRRALAQACFGRGEPVLRGPVFNQCDPLNPRLCSPRVHSASQESGGIGGDGPADAGGTGATV